MLSCSGGFNLKRIYFGSVGNQKIHLVVMRASGFLPSVIIKFSSGRGDINRLQVVLEHFRKLRIRVLCRSRNKNVRPNLRMNLQNLSQQINNSRNVLFVRSSYCHFLLHFEFVQILNFRMAFCPFAYANCQKSGYPWFRLSPTFLRYAPERLRRHSYPCHTFASSASQLYTQNLTAYIQLFYYIENIDFYQKRKDFLI